VQIFQVGGAVRDELLGLPVRDRDWVVVGATAEDMVERGFRKVGRNFPVFLHPQTHEEYALARTERKVGPGYTGFVVHATPDVTLEDDLRRRDLTINAMAKAPDGTLIDPYGGRADLEKRTLRHVSPAFREDPLRILRVARLAARLARFDFQVAPETMNLMRTMVASGELGALAKERIWYEIERALTEGRPSRFIEVLGRSRALHELLPEFDALSGLQITCAGKGNFDAGELTLQSVDFATARWADARIGFAVLCHRMPQAVAAKRENAGVSGHSRPPAVIKDCCQRLHVPRKHRDLAFLVAGHFEDFLQVERLTATRILSVLEQADAIRRKQRFDLFRHSCIAIAAACDTAHIDACGERWRQYFGAARSVHVSELVERGLSGAQLGDEVRRQRLAAIAAAIGDERRP